MWPIYDFVQQLKPQIDMMQHKKLTMTKCHQFLIHWEGIKTKQHVEREWSTWRGKVKKGF